MSNEILKLLDLIPCFDGDVKSLSNFINTVDEINLLIIQTNPSEITKKLVIISLKNKIQGKAAQSLSTSTINSWRDLKLHLIQNYSDTRSEHTLMYEITHLKQNKDNILDHFTKFNELFLIYKSKIECKYESNVSTILVNNSIKYFTQCFINNCKEPFRSQLSARNPQMLTEILNLITNDLQYIHNQCNLKNIETPKTFTQNTQNHFDEHQHQSPMQKYPSQNYESKPFSPRKNVRNAQFINPTPMSIQTRQSSNRSSNYSNQQHTSAPSANFRKTYQRPTFTSEELFNADPDPNFKKATPIETEKIEEDIINEDNFLGILHNQHETT